MHYNALMDILELAKLRTSQGVTTAQLAGRLGVNQSTVVRVEQSALRRAISLSTLERYVGALGFEARITFRAMGKRRARPSAASRSRTLTELMQQDELERVKTMSPLERFEQALGLSEFAMELSKCPK